MPLAHHRSSTPAPIQGGSNVTRLPVDLVLAWFTSQENLHHMLAQTALPIAESVRAEIRRQARLADSWASDSNPQAPVFNAPFIAMGQDSEEGWEHMKPGWGDSRKWVGAGEKTQAKWLKQHGQTWLEQRFRKWNSSAGRRQSTQYEQLLSMLPIQPTVLAYSGDHEVMSFRHTLKPVNLRRHNRTMSIPSAYTATVFGIEKGHTYCFRELHVVNPDKAPPLADVMRFIWHRMTQCDSERVVKSTVAFESAFPVPTNTTSAVVCIIVQRNESRRILNLAEAATIAGRHCGKVHVVELSQLSLLEQVAVFLCPEKMVVMAVHGAGLAWNKLIGGQDPDRPQVGGVIEWGLGKFGINGYYKNPKMSYKYRVNPNVTYPNESAINEKGCHIQQDPGCMYPDKWADFYVDLPAFESDLSAMLSNLN